MQDFAIQEIQPSLGMFYIPLHCTVPNSVPFDPDVQGGGLRNRVPRNYTEIFLEVPPHVLSVIFISHRCLSANKSGVVVVWRSWAALPTSNLHSELDRLHASLS